jgi:hypothetical protein
MREKDMKKNLSGLMVAAGIVASAFFVASPASADIIFDKSLGISAQGFGAAPRLLTVQTTGTESGCASDNGGALALGSGSCISDASVTQGNGYTNLGGDENNGPNQNGLGDLSGFTDANQIVIIYNPSQTGNLPGTDIQDLTLKFYDASGNLIISVDGGCGTASNCLGTASDPLFFASAGFNLGNGGTGYALVLDATQAGLVDTACGPNLSLCTTLTAEATILNANDGPDSFRLVNISEVCTIGLDCPNPQNVPEPITLSLFGAGLIGAAAARGLRRKAKTA